MPTKLNGSTTPAWNNEDDVAATETDCCSANKMHEDENTLVVVESASAPKLCKGLAIGQSHSLLAFASNAVKASNGAIFRQQVHFR